MPRRNRGNPARRHPKGKARPSSWHRGPVAFAAKQEKLDAIEPVFVAAELDRAEVERASSSHRELVRDFEEWVASLARVSPCARAPLPAVLL